MWSDSTPHPRFKRRDGNSSSRLRMGPSGQPLCVCSFVVKNSGSNVDSSQVKSSSKGRVAAVSGEGWGVLVFIRQFRISHSRWSDGAFGGKRRIERSMRESRNAATKTCQSKLEAKVIMGGDPSFCDTWRCSQLMQGPHTEKSERSNAKYSLKGQLILGQKSSGRYQESIRVVTVMLVALRRGTSAGASDMESRATAPHLDGSCG